MRTKPTKAMRKATKPARKGDYARMVAAASEVIMRTRSASLSDQGNHGPDYVIIEFPYFVKFEEGFPKGQRVEKKELVDVRKINAVRLLDWLHKQGHSKYSARDVVLQTRQYEMLDNTIDRMFDIL